MKWKKMEQFYKGGRCVNCGWTFNSKELWTIQLTTLDCLIVGWQMYIVQASQNVLEKIQINLPPISKPHVSWLICMLFIIMGAE